MLTKIRQATTSQTDEGASAVEYGLLVAAIAALIVVIVFSLGNVIQDVFKSTCDEVKSGSGAASACNE